VNLSEYQPLARRTMKELAPADHIEHMAIGMAGEIGEMCDAVKKAFIYGALIDPKGPKDGKKVYGMAAVGLPHMHANFEEEGGDVWWYVIGDVPELKLSIKDLQVAFDYGLELAATWDKGAVRLILEINAQVAQAANALANPDMLHDPVGALLNSQIVARNMGRFYGFFELNLARSLTRNLAKLAKRHGDKFNDVGVLFRDLEAEQAILEGRSGIQPLSALIGAPLSDKNLAA
jgi:hypothetical protein